MLPPGLRNVPRLCVVAGSEASGNFFQDDSWFVYFFEATTKELEEDVCQQTQEKESMGEDEPSSNTVIDEEQATDLTPQTKRNICAEERHACEKEKRRGYCRKSRGIHIRGIYPRQEMECTTSCREFRGNKCKFCVRENNCSDVGGDAERRAGVEKEGVVFNLNAKLNIFMNVNNFRCRFFDTSYSENMKATFQERSFLFFKHCVSCQ